MADHRVVVVREPLVALTVKSGNRVTVGAPGPQGAPGTGQPFVWNQVAPSTVWNINHGFGRSVHVTVLDPAGQVIYPEVVEQTDNLAIATFGTAATGKAVVS